MRLLQSPLTVLVLIIAAWAYVTGLENVGATIGRAYLAAVSAARGQ